MLPVDAHIDILILGAFGPELAPFGRLLGSGLAGRVGVRSVAARATGIGLPAAAVGAATVLAGTPAGAVVIVGTCGAYRGGDLAIGDVAVARTARMVDTSVVAGLSQFPAPVTLALDSHAAMRDAVAPGARLVDVATTLAITVDDDAAGRIARATHCQVEHLELFGVATACFARSIPFACVLGVANFVGAGARDEWRAHHEAAEVAAAACVIRWLESGAEGA